MVELNEALVARYIAEEAVANGIFEASQGGYVFRGDRNDFIIEIKVFKTAREGTVRLREDDDTRGYD